MLQCERVNPLATQWLHDGSASEPLELVAAGLYRDLTGGLSPVLGVGGVGLMFARSLTLTANRFPFLAQVFTLDGTEAMANQLHLTLSLQDAATAEETCVALFSTFMGLLETLVGSVVATRLLNGIEHNRVPPHDP